MFVTRCVTVLDLLFIQGVKTGQNLGGLVLTHNEIFKKEVADCSPDARFLLEVMAMQWGRGDRSVLRWTVGSLSKLLHSPLTMVRKALLELAGLGLVELSTERSRNGGRPAHEYAFGDAIRQWFESNSVDYGHHSDRMATLLSGAKFRVRVIGRKAQVPKRQEPERDGEKRPVAPEGFLSLRNRLLLGMLLSRADRFGCVRDLPTKELQQLTGMNSDRVKHRLGRLVSLGLIRMIVPGVSSSIFRDGWLASSFYLNLNHPGFDRPPANAIGMSLALGDDGFGAFDRLEADLYDLRHQLRKRQGVDDNKALLAHAWSQYFTPEAVLRYLFNERPPALLALRVCMYHHAADLLDEFPVGKVALSKEQESKLIAALQAELTGLGVECPAESTALDSGAQDETKGGDTLAAIVVNHFCSMIVSIANVYQTRFTKLREAKFSGLRVCILPVRHAAGDGADKVGTVLFDGVANGRNLCTLVQASVDGGKIRDTWGREVDIPIAVRFSHGLLSKPKS